MKNKLLVSGISLLSLFFTTKISAQAPVAGFTIDQSTVCVGETIQITDASTDSPTVWSYTLDGASATSTLQNPTMSFTMAGLYNITLIASNGSGDSAPFTATVAVNALPSVAAGTAADVCAGDLITLSGSGASTYTWSGSVIDGSPFSPSSSTIYSVTGTDANGCENSATVAITVNPLPVLAISGGTGVCIGSAVTLTASGADLYTWSTSASGDVMTDSPTTNTTYSVTGTNTLTGCSNGTTNLVTVHSLPIVSVNSGTICSGGVFTMSPGGAVSYVFSNGAGTVAPTANDSYTITGTDANGCVSTAVSDVTVFALPVISVNSGTVCSGSGFTLVPSGAISYTVAPGNSTTVSPVSNTSYSVTGTDANGCVSAVAAVAQITAEPLPVVSVNSGTICAGDVFTFTPSGAVSYVFPAGSNTASPASTTSYSITGTDANGCVSAPAVSSVTVAALPVVSVNSGTICSGATFTMNPTGASTYVFSNGSNTASPTSNTSYTVTGTSAEGCVSAAGAVSDVTVHALPVVSVTSGSVCQGGVFTMTASGAVTYNFSNGSATVIPTANTSYSVTGVSAEGCVSSNVAISTVTVHTLPVLSITGNSMICIGQTATLTASGASTYTWSTSSNSIAVTVSPLANTTYTVDGTDVNGCSNTTSQLIVVNSLPTITVNSGVICLGGSFTLLPSGASTYVYSGGSAIVSPVTTSIYSVTGTDANGCVSATPAVATVSVVNNPTLTVSGATTICNGQTATLTANGAGTYSWSTNILTNTITLNPSSTTSYTVTGMIGNCSNSVAVSVSVNPLPVVIVTALSPTICTGESASLTASGANSYLWNGGATTSIIAVNPTVTTTYTVTGTANSCSSATAVTQVVNDCTGLSKLQNTNMDASVYPNPNNGEFTIRISQETTVKILNGIGQVVYSGNLVNGENQVTLANQPKGIYFVQVKQDGYIQTLKVVKN